MGSVVADSVVMRTEPGRQSAFVTHVCFDTPYPCPNLLLGPDTDYQSVYLMDGPVEADGYDWYLAATHGESGIFPEYVGWIPVGDSAGPWVIPASSNCPAEPIDLAEVTYSAISSLELLACVGGRELTLYGWHPAPPPGDTSSEDCQPLEHREAFCTFGFNVLRPEEAPWAGSADHLPWIAESAANLPAPPRDAWITVRGRFDHPASSECYDRTPAAILQCQIEFVISSYSTD